MDHHHTLHTTSKAAILGATCAALITLGHPELAVIALTVVTDLALWRTPR